MKIHLPEHRVPWIVHVSAWHAFSACWRYSAARKCVCVCVTVSVVAVIVEKWCHFIRRRWVGHQRNTYNIFSVISVYKHFYNSICSRVLSSLKSSEMEKKTIIVKTNGIQMALIHSLIFLSIIFFFCYFSSSFIQTMSAFWSWWKRVKRIVSNFFQRLYFQCFFATIFFLFVFFLLRIEKQLYDRREIVKQKMRFHSKRIFCVCTRLMVYQPWCATSVYSIEQCAISDWCSLNWKTNTTKKNRTST